MRVSSAAHAWSGVSPLIERLNEGCGDFSAIPILAWLGLGMLAGFVVRGSAVESAHYATPRNPARIGSSASSTPTRQYACSMFCLPPQPKPGLCPVCGMKMVEVGGLEPADGDAAAPTLTLSPRAARLASIRLAPVARKLVAAKIRMVGQVDYDEYNKARNRPFRVGQTGRSIGKAVARMGVTLEAYEPDLAWIRLGQSVTIESDVCAGKTFAGKIVFIDSKLDSFTRTVEVRVRVPGLDERLKLQTLVRATISATLNARGEPIAPEVGGQWICPMHADITKDEYGKCDICGMDLREASTLGYRSPEAGDVTPPLVIPATAPLITGKRAVVYVAIPDSPGTYEGRTIVLGPRAGDYYTVREGLNVGEQVVVNGNFKIDSALQILARRSMMSPESEFGDSDPVDSATDAQGSSGPATGGTLTVPDRFSSEVETVLESYFRVHAALCRDDLGGAKQAVGVFWTAVGNVNTILLGGPAQKIWGPARIALLEQLSRLAKASNIEDARAAFDPVSTCMWDIVSRFKTASAKPVFHFFCPMAFDHRGARWLQADAPVRNPYFGSAMLDCGKLTDRIPERPLELPSTPEAPHGDGNDG